MAEVAAEEGQRLVRLPRSSRAALSASLAFVGVLALFGLVQAGRAIADARTLQRSVQHANELHRMLGQLQKERGMTCVYISSDADAKAAVMRELVKYREATDAALDATAADAWAATGLGSRQWFADELFDYRQQVGNRQRKCTDTLNWYTEHAERILKQIARAFKSSSAGEFWSDVCAYQTLLSAMDKIGLKRARGGDFFASGGFSQDESISFAQLSGAGNALLVASLRKSTETNNLHHRLSINSSELMRGLTDIEAVVLRNELATTDSQRGLSWFAQMTDYIALLDLVESHLSDELSASASSTYLLEAVRFVGMVCATLAAFVAMVASLTYLYNRQRRIGLLRKAEQRAPIGIPRHAMGRARTYDSATICYADIAGFAKLASQSSAAEVIVLLNELYSSYDSVIREMSCRRVDSATDLCLLVAGVEDPAATHSDHMCTLALSLMRTARDFRMAHRPDDALLVRFAIATGKFSSGLVSSGKTTRPLLFGPCVDEAAALLSACLPLRILVGDSTRKHLAEHHEHSFAFLPNYKDDMGDDEQLRSLNQDDSASFSCSDTNSFDSHWLIEKEGLQFKVNLNEAAQKTNASSYWPI